MLVCVRAPDEEHKLYHISFPSSYSVNEPRRQKRSSLFVIRNLHAIIYVRQCLTKTTNGARRCKTRVRYYFPLDPVRHHQAEEEVDIDAARTTGESIVGTAVRRWRHQRRR
jgi:hypothetical protein